MNTAVRFEACYMCVSTADVWTKRGEYERERDWNWEWGRPHDHSGVCSVLCVFVTQTIIIQKKHPKPSPSLRGVGWELLSDCLTVYRQHWNGKSANGHSVGLRHRSCIGKECNHALIESIALKNTILMIFSDKNSPSNEKYAHFLYEIHSSFYNARCSCGHRTIVDRWTEYSQILHYPKRE